MILNNIFNNKSIFKNVNIIHAKQAAFNILVERGNFIHSIDHALRVHDNAMYIFMNIKCNSITELIALKLASYWHDTGKDDWSEKEEVPHNILSSQLFERYAIGKGIPDDIIKITQSIICCHRNRGKDYYRAPMTYGEKTLWDADKLDIVNPVRVTEIIWSYMNGYKVGEFNLKDTISYWMEIKPQFSNKFYFEVSRNLFQERYPSFRELVKKINANYTLTN